MPQDKKTIADQTPHLPANPITEDKAARYLGVAKQTIRNWRCAGKGPAYLNLSPDPRGRIAYLVDDLQSYRDQCRIVPGAPK